MKTYQSSTKENKKNFFKRHRSAIIAILSVIAVAVVIALAVVFSQPDDKKPVDAPVVNPPVENVEPKTVMPMTSSTLGLSYAYKTLKWWDTLEIWKIHPAVDFVGGGDVVAIRDGNVKSVEKTSLQGNVVTIEHEDGYVSVYKSLEDDVAVAVGDSVKAGDKIGKAGKSVEELNTGAHLHLEVKKDGKYVDPMTLLPESDDK